MTPGVDARLWWAADEGNSIHRNSSVGWLDIWDEGKKESFLRKLAFQEICVSSFSWCPWFVSVTHILRSSSTKTPRPSSGSQLCHLQISLHLNRFLKKKNNCMEKTMILPFKKIKGYWCHPAQLTAVIVRELVAFYYALLRNLWESHAGPITFLLLCE